MEPIDIKVAGYDLKREIGSGGMARVFLATQISLSREVAIKVMRKDLAVSGGEDLQRRFLHEGQMLASLVHPNIVSIYDINQTDEVSYMAMEYLKGGTLSERIKQGLSVAAVIRITTQVAYALGLAHENKIVHRDLKPDNIMFRDENTPVLTDFGIAKKTDAQHSLTKTGMVVGTPYYMSPEQITGKPIDGRSDIYSLGVMFYELLAGELPFRAEEPLALAMQHVQEPAPPLPEDVAELQPVIDCLLAKSADDRFDTMIDFCEAMKDLVSEDASLQAKLSGETLFNSDQFTDPGLGTGGLSISGRRITGAKSGIRTGARRKPTHSDATSVMTSGTQPRRGGLGWRMPAAVVAFLAVASIAGYFAFFAKPDIGLTEAEQKAVDNLMNRAQAFINLGQYEAPAGANAAEMLAQVQKIAPGYPDALEAAEDIAEIFEANATIKMLDDDVNGALADVQSGLRIAPDYAGLLTIQQDITARLEESQRLERIAALVAQAQQQVAAGKRIEPEGDNAFETFQDVIAIDAANPAARQGLDEIQTWMVSNIREQINQGQLESAGELLVRAEQMFPEAGAIVQARRNLDQAAQYRRETGQINTLLAQAEDQFEAERYVYPPGDNALESYLDILNLRPEQPEAVSGLDRIASHFEQRARAAYQNEDFGSSVEFARNGLRAQPDNEQLLAVQRQATGRLDAAARQIEQELQAAERLVQEGQFLSGDNGGALASYERVLELSPGNERALEGIVRLPDQIYDVAEQMRRDSNYLLADRLLERAAAQYPDQPRFASLQQEVGTLVAEQERRVRLNRLLAESQRLIDVRPMTRSSFDQAAEKLKEIASDFPNELQVRSQTSDLTNALAREADAISRAGNHDAAFRLLDHGLSQFADNRTLLAARTDVQDRQQAAIAAEEARLAALRGQLAVDASPWGEVTEVRDAQGNLTRLPADATTPLVLTLSEGNYEVTIRGGDNSLRQLNVDVVRQDLVSARAEFTGMDADAYFESSGW